MILKKFIKRYTQPLLLPFFNYKCASTKALKKLNCCVICNINSLCMREIRSKFAYDCLFTLSDNFIEKNDKKVAWDRVGSRLYKVLQYFNFKQTNFIAIGS